MGERLLYALLGGTFTIAIGVTVALGVLMLHANAGLKQPPPTVAIKTDSIVNVALSGCRDFDYENRVRHSLFGNVDKQYLRWNLHNVSKQTHPAGTWMNRQVTDYLINSYKSYGLDVRTHEYQVFLTYPDIENPNTISVQTADGDEVQLSNGIGDKTGPQEALDQLNSSWATNWWNGYSRPGTVAAPIVYCNYGSIQDFDTVESLGHSLQGAIALVRYGQLWRGAKVYEASRRGAVGVILYSDPADVDSSSGNDTRVWPEAVYLQPGAAQRGSLINFNGDPLTAFYPSQPFAPRLTNESTLRQQLVLANVPVTPIGYRDAVKIFNSMDGPTDDIPDSFVGRMNTTYRLTSSLNYTLSVHGNSQTRVNITDVCAHLWGLEEPDHVLILSNHYDAWTNGAQDPNSGTSIMLETGRVLMQTRNLTNWRPRRTIMICNWDAEEYGLVGSTEYVEEMLKNLEYKAVGLLNIDLPIRGNLTLSADGIPSMFRALLNATKLVGNPNPSERQQQRHTVYDSWAHYTDGNSTQPIQPRLLDYPGSGSDHYTFMAYAGVPVLDYEYTCYPQCGTNFYHTMDELPWTEENLVDQQYDTFVAVTQLTLELARLIADTPAIPYNLTDTVQVIQVTERQLEEEMYTTGLNATLPLDDIFSHLRAAIQQLAETAHTFQTQVNLINSGAEVSRRQVGMLNNRLLQFERAFIQERTLYPGSYVRHVVFSASVQNTYAGVTYSGVRDSIQNYEDALAAGDATGAADWLQQIQLALADVTQAVAGAAKLLALDGYRL